MTLSIVSDDSTSRVMARLSLANALNRKAMKRNGKGKGRYLLFPVRVFTKICMMIKLFDSNGEISDEGDVFD